MSIQDRLRDVLMLVRFLALSVLSAAQLIAQPTSPPRRAHHALVYDEAGGRVLLTGGSSPHADGGCCAFFNDLWAFDGTRWSALTRSGAEMSGMQLAYDSRAKRVVSFGGYSAGRSMNDVRTLVNDSWTSLGQHPEISAAEPGFVYDSRRNTFVAFGGSAGRGQTQGDTWEFDGGRWSKVATASPPARQAFAMVFDERRGRTVAFGGSGTSSPGQPPQRFDDTWEFDGASWTRAQTSRAPSARVSPGAVYDSRRGVVILFGGLGADGFLGDTWSWNGTEWTKLDDGGQGKPEARAMGYLASDRKRDRSVLFGGRKGWPDGDLNDTWEWDGSTWSKVRS